MSAKYPENVIWYVESWASEKVDPAQGSAVAIRLQKKGKPETAETYLLTCAHVVRGKYGGVREIRAWPPGSGYNDDQARVVSVVPEIKNLPADDKVVADDWTILRINDGNVTAAGDFVEAWATASNSDEFHICGYPGGTGSYPDGVITPTRMQHKFPFRGLDFGVLRLIGNATRAGVSGGGVFRAKGGELVGLHRARFDDVLQLHAVSTTHILNMLYEKEFELVAVRPILSTFFRHAPLLGLRNKYFFDVIVQLTSLLVSNEKYLLNELRDRIPNVEDVHPPREASELPQAVATALLRGQPFELLKKALEDFYEELEGKTEAQETNISKKHIDSLWELYVTIMTYRFHPDGVARIVQQEQEALIRVEAITCAAVELMMACRDNGKAALIAQEVKKKDNQGNEIVNYDIRSEFQLPMPPESGRNPEEFVREFLLHLHTIFRRPVEHRTKSNRAIARDIRKQIRKKIEEDGRTRFIVFLPDNPSHQHDYVLLANLINEHFKESDHALVQVVLVKSEKEDDHEYWQDKEDELDFLREKLLKRTGQQNS